MKKALLLGAALCALVTPSSAGVPPIPPGPSNTNASNINSGVLGSNFGGAGAVSGVLKGNGAGVVSGPASCYDLSNGATGCATTVGTVATQNTGTSGHTIPFLDGANTWSGSSTFSSSLSATGGLSVSGGGITSSALSVSGSTTLSTLTLSSTSTINGAMNYTVAPTWSSDAIRLTTRQNLKVGSSLYNSGSCSGVSTYIPLSPTTGSHRITITGWAPNNAAVPFWQISTNNQSSALTTNSYYYRVENKNIYGGADASYTNGPVSNISPTVLSLTNNTGYNSLFTIEINNLSVGYDEVTWHGVFVDSNNYFFTVRGGAVIAAASATDLLIGFGSPATSQSCTWKNEAIGA